MVARSTVVIGLGAVVSRRTILEPVTTISCTASSSDSCAHNWQGARTVATALANTLRRASDLVDSRIRICPPYFVVNRNYRPDGSKEDLFLWKEQLFFNDLHRARQLLILNWYDGE